MSRKKRIEFVVSKLKENDGIMPFDELCGAVSAEYGTSEKTFWSYLEALKAEGKIDYPSMYRERMGSLPNFIINYMGP